MLLSVQRYTTILILVVHLLTANSTCPSLDEKLASIDSIISYAVEKIRQSVGLSVGIVENGQVAFAKGYGLRNVSDSHSYVTNRSIFQIASCTKAFTAYSIDLLRQDGLVDWDDVVSRHIPDFKMYDMCATENAQIKDLASHNTGLPRHDCVWDSSTFPRNDFIKRLPHLKPNRRFREKYQYNNIMIVVEGIVVERASNRSWEQFVHERIFAPLSMQRTFAQIQEAWDAHADDVCTGHTAKGSTINSVPYLEISNGAPAGAIVSTAEDMAKWVQRQLSLTGRSTEMHDIHTSMPRDEASNYGALGYGYGWFIGYHNGRKVVHHGGSTVGFVAYVTLFPEENRGMVVLSNSGGRAMGGFIQNLNLKISDILNGCDVSEAENKKWVEDQVKLVDETQADVEGWNKTSSEPPKVEHPEEYVGSFENAGYGIVEVFMKQHGSLAASFNGNCTVTATTVRDLFYFENIEGQFKLNTLGDVVGVYLAFEPRGSSIYFQKKVPAVLSTSSYLQQFVGVYAGKITVRLVKVGAKNVLVVSGLTLMTKKYNDAELTPLKPKWFGLDRLYFKFVLVDGVVQQLHIHKGDSYKILNKKLD